MRGPGQKLAGKGVAEEIAALSELSREDLARRWQEAYEVAPPKSLRHDLLVRSAAWHVQAKRLGGLSPATRRALKAAMTDVERAITARRQGPTAAGESASGMGKTAGPVRKQPAPGARLIREWNGKRHVIAVIEDGFVFEARVYNSLTAIAHQITGTHWSGPRFFGL
jgi:hypothetical protein